MRRTIPDSEIIKGAIRPIASFMTIIQFWMCSVVVACFVATAFTAKAEILIDRKDGLDVTIAGTISTRDANKFQEISKELEYVKDGPTVYLDSIGGDVSAAISIGRLVRKNDFWTAIKANGKCYSSCALIFIAGVERHNFGELGLHRPYFASSPKSRETLEEKVPLMLSTLKNYINEMGVTDNFYQQMVNTEPSQVVIYDSDEYTALVPETDPTFSEILIARNARYFGTTTSEMRQRLQDAEGCGSPKSFDIADLGEWAACQDAIKWGVGGRVYLERMARSKKECWFNDKQRFSPEAQATIDKTPQKLMWDLPLYVRLETCVRSVMLGQDTPAKTGWFGWIFGQ